MTLRGSGAAPFLRPSVRVPDQGAAEAADSAAPSPFLRPLVRVPDNGAVEAADLAAPSPFLRPLVRLPDHLGREANHLDPAEMSAEPSAAPRPCVPAITSLRDAPRARHTGTPTWSRP